MPSAIKHEGAPVSRGTGGMTTALNSLGSATWSSPGSAVTNRSNNDTKIQFKVNLASFTPVGSFPYIMLALVHSADGSNFEDAPGSTNPSYHNIIGPFPVTTGASAKHVETPEIELPPGDYKPAIYNGCGAAFASSGNTVESFTNNRESQ